jgi:hypothetical protein
MTVMVLTPTVTPGGPGALTLTTPARPGTYLANEGNEGLLPVVVWDEEYADSIDTEGALRIRSRPTNPVGTGRVFCAGTDAATLRTQSTTWLQTIEACRRNGGTLVHTPDDGVVVTYDIISAFVTAVPFDAQMLRNFMREFSFSLTYKPYGRLSEVTIL